MLLKAPVKPAAAQAAFASPIVLFVPSAEGSSVSTRLGTTFWPAEHVDTADVVTVTVCC